MRQFDIVGFRALRLLSPFSIIKLFAIYPLYWSLALIYLLRIIHWLMSLLVKNLNLMLLSSDGLSSLLLLCDLLDDQIGSILNTRCGLIEPIVPWSAGDNILDINLKHLRVSFGDVTCFDPLFWPHNLVVVWRCYLIIILLGCCICLSLVNIDVRPIVWDLAGCHVVWFRGYIHMVFKCAFIVSVI